MEMSFLDSEQIQKELQNVHPVATANQWRSQDIFLGGLTKYI